MKVKDIPEDIRQGLYYWHYFIEPQIDRLAAIPGLTETEPQFVALMFDAQVQSWSDAHSWLQKSLNAVGLSPQVLNPDTVKRVVDAEAARLGIPETSMEAIKNSLVLGADGKYKLKNDGLPGPVSRAAVQLALEAGKIHEVNDRIVDMRYAHNRKNVRPGQRGVFPRVESFLSNGPAPTYGPYGKNGVRPY
jgi:hypothetical protein